MVFYHRSRKVINTHSAGSFWNHEELGPPCELLGEGVCQGLPPAPASGPWYTNLLFLLNNGNIICVAKGCLKYVYLWFFINKHLIYIYFYVYTWGHIKISQAKGDRWIKFKNPCSEGKIKMLHAQHHGILLATIMRFKTVV